MERQEILNLMNEIQEKRGRKKVENEEVLLSEIGFRSLDFSELALRVERSFGGELPFDAVALREIRTAKSVLDFLEEAVKSG
jgi:acyl carrier protein